MISGHFIDTITCYQKFLFFMNNLFLSEFEVVNQNTSYDYRHLLFVASNVDANSVKMSGVTVGRSRIGSSESNAVYVYYLFVR